MATNRQKKKRLVTRAFAMALFMALFTQASMAQSTTIFMRDGTTTIERSTGVVYFYDSHGPSNSTEWWNQWYQHNEDYIYVFKPKTAGDKIKVTFVPAPCYDGNTGAALGDWAMRINDDFLHIYEGTGVNDDNLIVSLTGNTEQQFSVMADGAITFHFVANSRYREEGWFAQVELVQEDQGMQPQAPFIRRSTCNNAAELLPTTLGAQIWFTTDSSDPRSSSTAELYKNEIEFPATGNLTVKAASKLAEGDDWSAVATVTFTDDDRIPVPGVPTITRTAGTNTIVMTPAAVPDGVNETYIVRYTYTTNGNEPAEPDLTNSTLYSAPFTCTVPGTRYKAKTFGLSCSNWVSTATATLTVTEILCPAPVISFGDDMFITASEGGVVYNILYTLDGSEPSLSPVNGTESATTVSLAGIPYGTTVKALAFKMNGTDVDTQFQPSEVVSKIYVPTNADGSTQNGVFGSIVLIDDREDHTWSYYSDSLNPIHSLKPVDVKITYSGNGTNNMTPNRTNPVVNPDNDSYYTENATNVHVNIDAPENEFVYLKTLENDSVNGKGNYSYTTIPNPFQVRPIHHASKGGEQGIKGDLSANALQSRDVVPQGEGVIVRSPAEDGIVIPQAMPDNAQPQGTGGNRDVTYEKVTSSQSDWSGTYLLSTTAGYAFKSVITSDSIGDFTTLTVTNSGSTIANPGSAAILTIAKYSGDNSYYTIQINGGNYLLSGSNGLCTSASASNSSNSYYCYWNISYSSSNGILINCPAWDGTYNLKFINYTYEGDLFQYFKDISTNYSSYYDDVDFFKQTSSGGSDCPTEDFSSYTAANYNADTYDRPSDWFYATSGSYAPRVSSNSALNSLYTISGMSSQGNFLYMIGSGNYSVMPRTENLTSVTFKYAFESASSGTLQVGYVTNTSSISSSFTAFTDVTLSGTTTLTTVSLTTADITTLNNNPNAHVAFYWNYSSNYGVGIDDIEVCSASSSDPSISVTPTTAEIITGNTATLTATTYNATGATITWSSNNTAVATVVTNSKDTSTATVTGVAPGAAVITASITVDGTTYTASSAITVEDPSYCSPNPTSVDGTGMHPVSFGSGSQTVYNEQYPTSSPYYGDYSSQVGAYMQGETATVTITYSTGTSTVYSYGTIIWVDWDKDYTFEDSEIVYTGTSAQGSGGTPQVLTATFNIPVAQAVDDYRMRIAGADEYFDTYIGGTSTGAHDPCFTSTYAVCHDYTLRVTAAVEPPAAPVFSVASGTYTTAQSVTITCATSGATIYYTTDGSTPSASNGIIYSSAVTISATTTLKAVAVKDGATSSVTTATYYINTSGGGSLTCEDFESYSSSANSSYNTEGSLPTGWTWYYLTNYHGNSNYAPHLYNNSTFARDGVGIIMTAGYDSYSSDGGGSSTTYIGRAYFLVSNITLQEGATVTFNTWVENTAYGVMSYGYMSGTTFYPVGVATTAAYSDATNADGITTFTVSAAASGYPLTFRWLYETSTSGDNYSAVIDNICQEISGAPNAPVFDLASGDYTGTQTVTITCSTADATIYYTTDGTTPSAANGTAIPSGNTVTISSTTTLQAIAVNTYGASAVTSATYTISQGASSNSDYRGFYAWRVKRVSDGLTIKSKDGTVTYSASSGSNIIPAETELKFITANAEGNEVEFEALWAQAYITTTTSTSGLNANVGYERNFMVLSSNPSTTTTTQQWPTSNNTTTTYGQYIPLGNYSTSSSSYYSCSQEIFTPSQVGQTGEITQIAFRVQTAQSNSRDLVIYLSNTSYDAIRSYVRNDTTFYRTIGVSASEKVFTGTVNFSSTGWKTITLDKPYYYDGNGNLLLTVLDNTATSHTVVFRTYQNSSSQYRSLSVLRSSGAYNLENYYYSTYSTNDVSTYSNQIQFVISKSTTDALSVPLTITSYNPDGTGGASSVYLSGALNCGADLKIENIKMNGLPVLSANGHNLVVGRGVTPAISDGICADNVYGYQLSTAPSSAINSKLRMESGVFNNVFGLYGSSTSIASAETNVGITFGTDYDRAVGGDEGHGKFEIAGTYSLTYSITGGTATSRFNTNVLSGTYTCATDEFYMGYWNSSAMKSVRYNTIYDGIFANGLTLGIDQSANANTETAFLRVYGGTFQEQMYAAGQYAQAKGSRRIVLTGGEFSDWISAGCYGTNPSGGYLDGNTALYFGGKANQTSDAGLFGSGYGTAEVYGTADEDSYYVNASTVVIADQAQVAGSVYGGGNNGFAMNSTDVHVLGGTIGGNVFGGSNKSKGATITVNVKGGTIAGNVYGGSDTKGSISGLATVNVSGGSMANVFGGGLGSTTYMNSGTEVNVSDGAISGNVYGGGEQGELIGSANNATPNSDAVVTISGGSVNDVFGAGKGGGGYDANVSGNTTVTVSGGTVNGAVYGGGENGTINPENAIAESTTTTEDVVKTVGTSAGNSYSYGPVDHYYSNGYIQTIYQSSDLSAGIIKTIGYNSYSSTSYSRTVTIYMGTTSNNTSSWISTSSLTQVYNGTVSFSSSGWKDITLDTPFEYDGSSNLVVVFYYTGSYGSSHTRFYYSSYSYSGNRVYFSDSSISTPPSTTGSAYSYYPLTRFTIETTTTTTPATTAPENLLSTVTVSGGEVKGDVFGGGKMGTTQGNTVVNITNGILRQNVFGGAYGVHDTVFVAGLKTVNMMGGRVYGSVYGGSRNANDGNSLTLYKEAFATSTETAPTSITNMTGGQIDQHLYAAGYYGNTFGSVYAFIGNNAVQGAPHNAHTTGAANLEYTKSRLLINGTVWAGGDWGTFAGTFGAPTVTGNSNIYIDGEGYNTESTDLSATNYMNIVGSILGSGTSCDAGRKERTLIVRNFGVDVANTGADADVNPVGHASRQATSVQRFHRVVFDNTHIGFTGQGKVNSLNNTEKYALYEIDTCVIVANGSTLVMNAPSSQLKSVHSVICDETYAASPTYTKVNYDGLTSADTDNKIRVNGGSYVEVKYAADPDNIASGEKIYGELEGFFHIMTSNDSDDATCAYARPKQSQEEGNIIPETENNADDGGFVAYVDRYNRYTAAGALVDEGGQVQLRYENHTPNMRDNSEYFRIWRYGGNRHYLEGIFNADATEEGPDYKTVTVTIQLPAWTGDHSYYRFNRTGTSTLNTLIDYGSDVLTYNAACYQDPTTGNNWMYYDYENEEMVDGVGTSNTTLAAFLSGGIDDNPNLNYGLVIQPGQAMNGNTLIICGDADEYLANLETPFTCADNTKVPTITFTLTYSNNLSANMTWDPILIPLVQCSQDGTITDYVTVALTINTSTEITSGFVTQVYARMIGGTNTKEQSTVNVVLPTFPMAENGEESQFTLVKAEFTPDEALDPNTGEVDPGRTVSYEVKNNSTNLDINNFFLTVSAVANPDNTDDWRFVTGEQDGAPGDGSSMDKAIGQAGGRSALTFGITLYYNSNVEVGAQTHMGDVTFTIGFTNHEGGTGEDHYSEFTVTVEVYRVGAGKRFYVDGINGVDASDENRGKFPDLPAKTVNYIFNRLGFLPGDNIFVVDELPITKATTWDGSAFQNEVNIYRYPGGHPLSGATTGFDNSPYLGTLVDVTKELNMKGIMMDGMYAESQLTDHNSSLYPSTCSFDGEADAPMITIENGGRLNLTSTTKLQHNYNTNNAVYGGAVNVAYGGILAMNMATSITENISSKGGGVYVDGAMIVSDSIYVFNNYETSAMSGQNNVYLAPVSQDKLDRAGSFRVVQIGTSAADAYGELRHTAEAGYDTKLGITKEDWSHTYDGYMPVVYAESSSESFLDTPYAMPQEIIVHDENVYDLERYVTDKYADSPQYLYWLGTWVTAQYWNPYYESNEDAGYTPYMTAAQLNDIHTAEQLAWVISLANGENGVDKTNPAYLITPITITKDIDMSANVWVPIGNETSVFTGTFDGNGHNISGLDSPLNRTNMGMFGATENATISDMVVYAKFDGNSVNMGTVVGTMKGGTLSNVEGAGTLTNNYANGNTGGLVGVNDETTGTAGVIHSSFSAATISGGKNIGGLIAVNHGNLINAYSNSTISGGTNVGGLVAINHGLVENCYNITETTYPFAATNDGTIKLCYAADDITTYVGSNESTLSGHGNYAETYAPHTYGYMYSDNFVTLAEGQTSASNTCVVDTIQYANNQIDRWPGLLSTLNHWVDSINGSGSDYTYTKWFRPTTQYINGDLPVLGFPKDNSMATVTGKALRYGAFDANAHSMYSTSSSTSSGSGSGSGSDSSSSASDPYGFGNQGFGQNPQGSGSGSGTDGNGNGVDDLLDVFEDNTGYIFVYDNAIDVEGVPSQNVHVFINEDVVLTQAAGAGEFINATVGVSFDNSCGTATDFFGNTLAYDWHMLSTPLADAPLGISYSNDSINPWTMDNQAHQVTGVSNSYVPNGTGNIGNWDLYSFYEPEYHWINLKRNSASHHHYDEPYDHIVYKNEETFTPGKGYMVAIDKDTYLCNDGTLNGPSNPVSIKLTKKSHDPGTEELGYNLLGNPYQAYLDVNLFLGNNGLSSYWVYVAENDNYIAGNADASTNPALPSATLHPHQGFFVLANSDNQTVNFDYSTMALTTPVANSYYRGEKLDYPLVNLFATSEKGKKDLAVIEFNRPEFGGSKKMRAINNADFELAAHMNNTRYSILFTEEGTDKVPVHFTTREEGTFTMTWSTYHGNFTSLFLVDNLTGARTDMLRTDSYTFTSSPDDYASRFYITFKCTGVEEYNEDEETFVWYDGNDWIVNGKGQLQVFDVLGHVLQSQRVSGEQTRLNLEGYAAGVYMLHLTDGKTSKVQKIVVR